MQSIKRIVQLTLVSALALTPTGCSDPQVYGSVTMSSGYSSYGYNRYNSGPRMRGSITVGGRIR